MRFKAWIILAGLLASLAGCAESQAERTERKWDSLDYTPQAASSNATCSDNISDCGVGRDSVSVSAHGHH